MMGIMERPYWMNRAFAYAIEVAGMAIGAYSVQQQGGLKALDLAGGLTLFIAGREIGHYFHCVEVFDSEDRNDCDLEGLASKPKRQ